MKASSLPKTLQTGWTNLDNPYKNDFERGNTDKFKLYFRDLGIKHGHKEALKLIWGTLQAIRLKKTGRDDWRVHSVKIDISDGGRIQNYLFKEGVGRRLEPFSTWAFSIPPESSTTWKSPSLQRRQSQSRSKRNPALLKKYSDASGATDCVQPTIVSLIMQKYNKKKF